MYSDQGHQWAEVAFEGVGWVTFEPTGSGGAPSRVIQARGDLVHSQGDPIKRGTVIEIDQWPRETRKGLPFDIGGRVDTLSGAPVDGMEVEIFINENEGTRWLEAGNYGDGKRSVRDRGTGARKLRRGKLPANRPRQE